MTLKLDTVICNIPARAFVKHNKSHNAYHSCDKCTNRHEQSRMSFPCKDYALRTDESFNERLDEIHHLEVPHAFEGTGVGMVSQFPLDYMHLVCLGIVRCLLNMWLRGPLTVCVPATIVEQMSAKLVSMRPYIPVEFARKTRSLRELDRWKATELRQFLLYTGPVMLASFLDKDLYQNFMLLFSGISILASPTFSYLTDYADTLLNSFVQHFQQAQVEPQYLCNI